MRAFSVENDEKRQAILDGKPFHGRLTRKEGLCSSVVGYVWVPRLKKLMDYDYRKTLISCDC